MTRKEGKRKRRIKRKVGEGDDMKKHSVQEEQKR
jgi:hypothetical protein